MQHLSYFVECDRSSNYGKIVAIDLETGDFEVDASEIAACDRLGARYPDAQIWMVRIGSRLSKRQGIARSDRGG